MSNIADAGPGFCAQRLGLRSPPLVLYVSTRPVVIFGAVVK